MRFGWLAAAAAMVLGAGQAQAARYIEFQVTGGAQYRFAGVTPTGAYGYTIESTDTFAFDTSLFPSSPNAPAGYFASSYGLTPATSYTVSTTFGFRIEGASDSSIATVSTTSQPGGPLYQFTVDLSRFIDSNEFQVLPITNAGYLYGLRGSARVGSAEPSLPGQITGILARSTDIAPASLRATEQLSITLLPEPTSWAMMIVGIGVVGAALRRRSQPLFARQL